MTTAFPAQTFRSEPPQRTKKKRNSAMTGRAKPLTLISAAGLLTLAGATAALADKDNKTPDWPCVQKKVDQIAVAQVWDGPSIEGLKGWWEDKALNDLIEPLVGRRQPLSEAETMIKTYAASLPAADRDAKLTLLFAGIFDKFTISRRAVMNGLEKFLHNQRDRAADIESQGTALGELQAKVDADASDSKAASDLAAAQDKFDWASRIFQERQNTIPVACEVPVLYEQRIYEVAKLIRAQMSK